MLKTSLKKILKLTKNLIKDQNKRGDKVTWLNVNDQSSFYHAASVMTIIEEAIENELSNIQ